MRSGPTRSACPLLGNPAMLPASLKIQGSTSGEGAWIVQMMRVAGARRK
jgi:hypothetical protein